jgi:thymidylate synthase ThyX
MEYPCSNMSDTNSAIADPKPATAEPTAQTDVYAIHGADPEVLAYAMAKYSRSSLNMKESLAEISSQRAEQFLNTFYFQYGHRSIADLAHIPFAIERLSLLAAISLVDEQRWDGQERSTRYQNFRKSGWYTPAIPAPQTTAYTSSIEALFAAYDKVGAGMLEALKAAIPQPAEMKDDAYVRTLKARAFDVARYLLPLATNTSLGQIVSARTLESQISRLLTSEFPEIRALGDRLKSAAASPAWNVTHDAARVLLEEAASFSIPKGDGRENFHARLSDALLREVKTSPTLVKYSAPSEYTIASRAELRHAAAELMAAQPIEPAPVVDLVEDAGSLEVELATSLLYPECHYSWRQIQRTVAALSAPRIEEIIALGTKHRGHHDELPRTFSAGQSFKFDILMDIGGFRDMHRHRRCVQLIQDYTDLHGYEEPVCPGQPTLAEADLAELYTAAMQSAHAAYRTLRDTPSNDRHSEPTNDCHSDPELAEGEESLHFARSNNNASEAAYLLPLGTRVRAMFKMDFAEALYIAELRSGVAGHFSYRRVAWEMYLAVAKRHPALAGYFRIEDVNQPIDLLKR